MSKMTFRVVQDFFKSWGMYPSEEDTDDLNPDVISNGINRQCYYKLYNEAESIHGMVFTCFCISQIDATDDSFYLKVDSWKELEEAWKKFNTVGSGR